jgi:hypothetical protein
MRKKQYKVGRQNQQITPRTYHYREANKTLIQSKKDSHALLQNLVSCHPQIALHKSEHL